MTKEAIYGEQKTDCCGLLPFGSRVCGRSQIRLFIQKCIRSQMSVLRTEPCVAGVPYGKVQRRVCNSSDVLVSAARDALLLPKGLFYKQGI